MSPGIKDVAKKAGVSTATVSHVINETRYVADETKKKVFDTMKELDYRPNSVARSLRSRKSNIIGLIVPILGSDTSNFFFMSVANGIESVLKENGYNLILSNSSEDFEKEKEQIKVLNTQNIDGLIIAPTAQDYINTISIGEEYPVVFVDRKPQHFNGDCVFVDGYQGVYNAIKLLIEKGHSRIGYMTGRLGISTSDDRLLAYKQALTDHNILIDDSIIKIGEVTYESGYQMTKDLLESQDVSALMVASNQLTMGSMGYLQEHKIEMPGKLALIGFDDYEWVRVTSPPVTAISQPAFELGQKAAEILLQRIENRDAGYQQYRLETKLIMRKTC